MDRRLDQIRRADVITILSPVMAEKPATGSKLHGWIRGALAWGVARDYLEFNVADGIGAALPSARKTKKHHAALPLLGGGRGVARYRELRGVRGGEGLSAVHHSDRGSVG